MSDERRLPRLSGIRLARLVLGFVALAAVAGWAASFVGLHGFALDPMHGYTDVTAWLVPGSFDGSAFACSVLVYRSSIYGRAVLRGRVLMYAFTAVSGWINWHFQGNSLAQWVGAALPFAAVLVFDVVLSDLRAEWEIRHGKRAFRLRLGLLALRWTVDRRGTWSAFRTALVAVPVTDLVGLVAPPNVAPPEPVRPSEPIVTEPLPDVRGEVEPDRPTTHQDEPEAPRPTAADDLPVISPVTEPESVTAHRPVPPETLSERTIVLRPIRDEAPAKVHPDQSAASPAKVSPIRRSEHVVTAKAGSDDDLVARARHDGHTTRRAIAAAYNLGTARAGRIARLVKEGA
jgi:hypothetical protein